MLKFCDVLFFLTLIVACSANEYDQDIRYYYMPIAAAAYSDTPNKCLNNINTYYNYDIGSNITLFRQIIFMCASLNDICSGYTAVDSQNSVIILSFRGTNKFFQQIGDGWDFDEMIVFITGGKVIKYFFNGFSEMWNTGLKDDILTLKNKYSDYHIIITGHSLGGSLASIATATMDATYEAFVSQLVTFGQPRIGDKDFANAFNSILAFRSVRIIHNCDIVPSLPPLATSAYYHHVEEIWYPNDMNGTDSFSDCSYGDGEDPKCSDSNISNLSKSDHYHFKT